MELTTKYENKLEVNSELRRKIANLKKQLNKQINRMKQQKLKNNIF